MSRKSKGINAERELIHKFHEYEGWSAIRVAGSGSNKYPSPDVIAGNKGRILAIECKTCKNDKKYIDKKTITDLKVFSNRFSAETWIGIKFHKKDWKFFAPENLSEKNKSHMITEKMAEKEGLTFKSLIK